MSQETNDYLMENFIDAHNIFLNIIGQMQECNVQYDYDNIKQKEMESYKNINSALVNMGRELQEYKTLMEDNVDFFNEKYNIYLKYISLYIISIIFIRVYHEIFSLDKFNEFWNYLVGLFLGTTYVGLLNKDLNDYQSDTKEKRDLINRLKTLKEEYKENHDKAVNEINYIFSLNDKLWPEAIKGKMLVILNQEIEKQKILAMNK